MENENISALARNRLVEGTFRETMKSLRALIAVSSGLAFVTCEMGFIDNDRSFSHFKKTSGCNTSDERTNHHAEDEGRFVGSG